VAGKKTVRSTQFAGDTDQRCEYEGRNAFATRKIKKRVEKRLMVSLHRKLPGKPHGMYDKELRKDNTKLPNLYSSPKY